MFQNYDIEELAWEHAEAHLEARGILPEGGATDALCSYLSGNPNGWRVEPDEWCEEAEDACSQKGDCLHDRLSYLDIIECEGERCYEEMTNFIDSLFKASVEDLVL
ncbi:hypothetical protein EDF62_3085 [Leucobacter luti]|uniref:Uncharacterized protein n=1 Tax=Leucobacter luti TaxID=340320 RepID=A0A4V3CXC8_9MICO|nr:hypothetical protein [Leucobacter luti]TDP89788.1 hypothetical protein EDF62_3085 [Leucobacter luti]